MDYTYSAFFDVDCLEITEVFWGFDVVGPHLRDCIVLGFKYVSWNQVFQNKALKKVSGHIIY